MTRNQPRMPIGAAIYFMYGTRPEEVVFHHPDGGGQAVELRKRLP